MNIPPPPPPPPQPPPPPPLPILGGVQGKNTTPSPSSPFSQVPPPPMLGSTSIGAVPASPTPPPPPPPLSPSVLADSRSCPPPVPSMPPPNSPPESPTILPMAPAPPIPLANQFSSSKSAPRSPGLLPPPPPPLSTLPHAPPSNINARGDANNNPYESPPIYQSISLTSTNDGLDDSFDEEPSPIKGGLEDDLEKNMNLLEVLERSIVANTEGYPQLQMDIQSTLSEIVYFLDSGTADEWNAKLYISDEKEFSLLTTEIVSRT